MEMNDVLDKAKEVANSAKVSITDFVSRINQPADLKKTALTALEEYYKSITERVSDLDRLKAQQDLTDDDVKGILESIPEFLRSGLSDYETVARYYADYLKNQGRVPRVSVDDNIKQVLSSLQDASESERVLLALNLLK